MGYPESEEFEVQFLSCDQKTLVLSVPAVVKRIRAARKYKSAQRYSLFIANMHETMGMVVYALEAEADKPES